MFCVFNFNIQINHRLISDEALILNASTITKNWLFRIEFILSLSLILMNFVIQNYAP